MKASANVRIISPKTLIYVIMIFGAPKSVNLLGCIVRLSILFILYIILVNKRWSIEAKSFAGQEGYVLKAKTNDNINGLTFKE